MKTLFQTLNYCCLAIVILCMPLMAWAGWNNPHQGGVNKNTRYSAFAEPPKTLDPARAYSSNEIQFIAQIYEPPLQYHLLKRPYTLVPLTTESVPTVTYYDKNGKPLPHNTNPKNVAYSIYDIHIKPGIYYQPHPAFAKDKAGNYLYHHLKKKDLNNIYDIKDFKKTGTRELKAADYAYQIKRLAHPKLSSPIYGLMTKHIVGLDNYGKKLNQAYKKLAQDNDVFFLDLRKYPIEGVKVLGPYHYQIKIKGVYPQFKYWLAMPFFAPIPWEADYFYSQPGMTEKNLGFDWYPVGTGPYLLSENNPNRQMVLSKNPNFNHEKYPTKGEPSDKSKGYLQLANQPLPLIDTFIFSLDKESIPRWNKFLQGYYDKSGIAADNFDQAVKLDKKGNPNLTEELKAKGIKLETTVNPAIFYLGFNMIDDIVGGNSEQKKKLRQAISIALDYEEFISIFMNGRGVPAHGPIPPSIFGYDEDNINHIVYFSQNNKVKRKPLAIAKKLLAEAGYPGGLDPKTGKPLILNYDVPASNNPDDKARLAWMRKQFAKLGIQLNIRNTDYNRFQDKVRKGRAQIFSWGWLADYPDPENFLFLLYGPNGKVKHGGENATNYSNPKFDELFEAIKTLPNGPEREQKINQALAILREDSPWVWGFHPINFTLSHVWNQNTKPNAIANNTLKYEKLNVKLRDQLRKQWNKPVFWPVLLLIGFLLLLMIPLIITYWKRESHPTIKRKNIKK